MNSSGTLPLLFIVAGILILLSMIFSATESAFLSVNKLRVRLLKSKHDKKAIRVWKLLRNKDKLINTLLICNNIVNIALSAIFTFIAVNLFGSAGVGIATFVVTILLLIFGEISPKTVATHHPEKVAFFFSLFIEILEIIFAPLVFVFTGISRFALKVLKVDTQSKKVSYTEEEIKTLLDIGHEQGILEANEKNMMSQVFKFTDLEAKDIMIPRKQIKAISINESYTSVIELAQRLRFSKFPVFKKDIDDIVGILYVKDMMVYKNRIEEFSVQKVMRPPLFILETKKMSSVQQMLRENRQSMAVVIDEYSGTYGILTREDIVREIFGPVTDDKRIYAHKVGSSMENLQKLKVDGFARLIDLNEKLGINLTSDNCETLGGYICEVLGEIPTEKDFIFAEGYKFSIEKMEEHRVKKIRIEKVGEQK